MQEYRDGSFGEILPIADAIQQMLDEQKETYALHIGSEEELLSRQMERMMERRLRKEMEQKHDPEPSND